jgi:Xaa-Pro aminopeptidase
LKNNFNRKFYPHALGHYLGLDTHDCSSIGTGRALEPGMVITIEPGLYIPVDPDIPEEFCGLGMRIEDDILITENGCEVLSKSAPKTVAEIEMVMNG